MNFKENTIPMLFVLCVLCLLIIIAKTIPNKPLVTEDQIAIDKTTYEWMNSELRRRTNLLEDIFDTNMDNYSEYSLDVTLTAYSASVDECDATPEVTASGEPSRVGLVALSPDLYEDTTIKHGSSVLLFHDGECLGLFKVEDNTSSYKRKNTKKPIKIERTVDILHGNKEAAIRWGIRPGRLVWIGE